MTEEELISLLRNGDAPAFEKLVKEHQHRVFNTCLGIMQQREEAEDVAQEVFIEVYQSIRSFRGDSKLSTWLYRIAVTRSLDAIRKKKRKKRFAILKSLFGQSGEELKFDTPHFVHPGVLFENQERSKILFAAIDTLPENQKTAFLLSKIEDLSQKEISEIMGNSVGAVESLLSRAKQNLQKQLEEFYKSDQ